MSSERQAAICRFRLSKNYEAILRNVRASDIVESLFTANVINQQQLNENSSSSKSEAARMWELYTIVYQAPDPQMQRYFDSFMRAIDPHADWLACQIRSTDVTEEMRHWETPGTSKTFLTTPSGGINMRRPSVIVKSAASEKENEPDAIAYSAGILAFEVIRDSLKESGLMHQESPTSSLADQPGPSSSGSNHGTMPSSAANSDQQDFSLNFGKVAESLDENDRTKLGIGTQQTELNIRQTAVRIRQLADLFDKKHHTEVSTLVDSAVNSQLENDSNWFSELAAGVLEGNPSWARIVTLFSFCSRFAIRMVRKVDPRTLLRSIGTVVVGFAEVVRDHFASWLSGIGGWAALDSNFEQIRQQIVLRYTASSVTLSDLTLSVLLLSICYVGYCWYTHGN